MHFSQNCTNYWFPPSDTNDHTHAMCLNKSLQINDHAQKIDSCSFVGPKAFFYISLVHLILSCSWLYDGVLFHRGRCPGGSTFSDSTFPWQEPTTSASQISGNCWRLLIICNKHRYSAIHAYILVIICFMASEYIVPMHTFLAFVIICSSCIRPGHQMARKETFWESWSGIFHIYWKPQYK